MADMKPKYLISSESYQRASEIAKGKELSRSEWRYITLTHPKRGDDLAGYRDPDVELIGPFTDREAKAIRGQG